MPNRGMQWLEELGTRPRASGTQHERTPSCSDTHKCTISSPAPVSSCHHQYKRPCTGEKCKVEVHFLRANQKAKFFLWGWGGSTCIRANGNKMFAFKKLVSISYFLKIKSYLRKFSRFLYIGNKL